MSDASEESKLISSQSDPIAIKRKPIKWIALAILIIIAILVFVEFTLLMVRNSGVDQITYKDGLASVYNGINSFAESPTGDLWVGMIGGVSKIDGENIQSYTTEDGLLARDARSMTIALDGDLWISTSFKGFQGVSRFNGEDWTQYTESDELIGRVNVIESDPYGNVWFGTNNGVSKYDGENWETFTSSDGFIANYVEAIEISPEGGVWFSGSGEIDEGYTYGLSYFDGKNLEYFTKEDGLAGSINTIEIDQNGVLWIGTFNGISRFDGEDWTTYTMADGLIDDHVEAIAFEAENIVWFGTSKGVTQFDGENWRSLLPLLSDFRINDLLVDDQNNLWVASNKGLYKYDTNRITLPISLYNNWQIIRIILVFIGFLLLSITGIHFSNRSIKERFRVSLAMSVKSVSISMIVVGFFSFFVIPPYHYLGLILLIPTWLLAVALTTIIGVFIGFLQKNDLAVTKNVAIVAGLFVGGFCGFFLVAISRMS